MCFIVCAVPPQKPEFKFLFVLLFVCSEDHDVSHQDSRHLHQGGARQWTVWGVYDAPSLHHSPNSHLECVNQDSVYAQLCSPDRFIQHKLVFLGLQRQRKCKLFETVYQRHQCCFKG